MNRAEVDAIAGSILSLLHAVGAEGATVVLGPAGEFGKGSAGVFGLCRNDHHHVESCGESLEQVLNELAAHWGHR